MDQSLESRIRERAYESGRTWLRARVKPSSTGCGEREVVATSTACSPAKPNPKERSHGRPHVRRRQNVAAGRLTPHITSQIEGLFSGDQAR